MAARQPGERKVFPSLCPVFRLIAIGIRFSTLLHDRGRVLQSYPRVVQKYWYSIDWDVEALWALDLPVEDMPVSELEWHLEVPLWPDATGAPYSATPRQVLEDPAAHAAEFERINAASMRYPLEVLVHMGRVMILDGVHRLANACRSGAESVRVRRVPQDAVTRLRATPSSRL